LFPRLAALIERPRFENDLDEELLFHVEMETRANVLRGMEPVEARRTAERALGGMAGIKEDLRALRGLDFTDALGQDLRAAARTLARAPAYSAIVALTIALGVGANTAMFSIVRDVLLRPLPYGATDRLLLLRQRSETPGGSDVPFSPLEIEDYRRGVPSIDSIVEYHSMPFILLGGKEPERVDVGIVSADFFQVLGVSPILGRPFVPADDRTEAEGVLLLSHDYWQQRFAGAPDVVGRAFEMNDRTHRVVGVLPELPRFPDRVDVFMPVASCPFRSNPHMRTERESRMVRALARAVPGVPIETVSRDLAKAAAGLKAAHPDVYDKLPGFRVEAIPLADAITARARPVLLLLAGTTGLILLIACGNVLNLTLSRLSGRERELAARRAIGANRVRIARQLVTESLILAVLGGAVGVLLALGGLDALEALAARLTPRVPAVDLDLPVLAFAILVTIATGLAGGVLPALIAPRDAVAGAKPRGVLVALQIAASLVLLSGAGLTLKSLACLERVDAGFEPERALTVLLDLDWSRYRSPETIRTFQHELLERLSEEPGIVEAALARTPPLNHRGELWLERLRLPGGGDAPLIDFHAVSPTYFRALEVPLVAGRVFTAEDVEGATAVAIVNRAAAARHWGGANPVGKRVATSGGRWRTIVGVVGDVRQYGLSDPVEPSVYVPLAQVPLRVTHLVVRTAVDPRDLVRAVEGVVHDVDPGQAVAGIATLEDARAESIAMPRLTAALLALFAALALAVTVIGLAGTLGLTVEARTREIGLRLALGAHPGGVALMVLRQGLALLLLGVAIGFPVSFALSSSLSNLLFEVAPHDAETLSLVALLLLAVTCAACLAPARRAAAIDPIATLRSDG
jgi:predicted permease